MPASLLDLLTIAAVVVVLWARPQVVLGLLLGAAFLVPAPLRVPHTHTNYLTVLHVLVLAGVGRVVVRWADGSLPPRALRLTAVHRTWIVYAAVVFASGVVLVSAGPVSGPLQRLSDYGAQLGFFVVALALLRELPDLHEAVRIAAGATLVAAAVGVVEHLTGDSLGHWLFARVPNAGVLDAAHPLSLRAGQERVRAGAEFALQYGWMLVMFLPFALVAALRTRRRLVAAPLVVILIVASVYWSYTRSALAAVGAVVLLVALLARDARMTSFALAAIGVGGLAVMADPALLSHVSGSADRGSIDVRFQRVAPILDRVAHHPFRGLGLGNLLQSGFGTTDNAYLLQYTELGVIGLVLLGALVVTALAQSAPAVLSADDDARLVGAACVATLVAFIASGMFYDAFTLLQAPLLLWFTVALGTVVAERSGVAVVVPRVRRRLVVGATAVAAAAGTAAFALAPVHVAVNGVFTAIAVAQTSGTGDPIFTGNVLADTVCAAAEPRFAHVPRSRIDCRRNDAATGAGTLRIEAPDSRRVVAAGQMFAAFVRDRLGIRALRIDAVGAPIRGRPTVWRTAPLWVPMSVLGLLLLVPRRRVRPVVE